VIFQEFATGVRARRAVAREPIPLALISLVRRNRRRYGGYLVHLGVLVLFVGVSASSSFQSVHDARLAPGQSVTVGSYRYTYVRPTASLHAASNGHLERISLGAMMHVSHNGGKPITINTTKDYFPSQDPSLGPVSRFFDGEATSEVGLKQGTLRDVWAAINPDTSLLAPKIAQGDKVFTKAGGELTAQQANEFLAVALNGLVNGYTKSPPPATFRLLVSPLVTWIWVGALVILFGALIAIWPSPRGMARRVSARYAARVGREVRIPA
jgi:cytochrome c-type biogenesis protein CcmF